MTPERPTPMQIGSDVKHTPGPWTLDDNCPGFVYCDDATGSVVARCLGKGFEFVQRPDSESEANAAFIVRAANCHDELVAALKAAHGAINDAFGQANAEYQGLDNLASKYDAKIQAFRERARAILTRTDSQP